MKPQNNPDGILLSVVIPALNEEKRLPATLEAVADYKITLPGRIEVIVVDDGSTDRTASVAGAYRERFDACQVLRHERNHGKGHAVKTGILAAQGQFVFFMDADNSTPIAELEKFWPHVSDNAVVIGSRHMHGANVVVKQPWYRILISRLGNMVIRGLVVPGVKDTQCGFKLFEAGAARKIFSLQRIRGWGFDVEVLAIAGQIFNFAIKEVPVSWYDSEASRLRPIRDAWLTLRELARVKFYLVSGTYRKYESK